MQLARFAVPALIGMLLFAGYSVYEQQQYNSLVGNYDALVVKHSSLLANYSTLATNYSALAINYSRELVVVRNQTGTISYLRQELNASSEAYHDLLLNYTRTNIMFRSPLFNKSIDIWGGSQNLAPDSYVVWELLDTFDNHISFHTSGTANMMILGIFQFVRLVNKQPYTVIFNSTGTQFQYDEPISEGCGGYVLVLRNLTNTTLNIMPDVTATYEYTPFFTGDCSP